MAFRWPWHRKQSRTSINGVERRAATLANPSDELLKAILGELSAVSGVNVTPLKAMGVATVYAIVNLTSKMLSTLPLKLMRDTGNRKDPVKDHPLSSLLTTAPNEYMTASDFLAALEGNRLLRGNAYCQVVRTGGVVRELIPLANTQVSFYLSNGIPTYSIEGKETPLDQILHLKDFTSTGLIGIATASHIRDVIGLAIALQDNASKFFANGSRISDVLKTDQDLSDDQAKRISENFKRRKEKGEDHTILVLSAGLDYASTRSNNTDSQMMEARKLQREEIAAAFGIPAHKAGILDHATFSNIEQMGIEFVTSYLQPICVKWEQALNHRLLTRREREMGLYFKFKLQGLMRGDSAARSAFYHNAILDGWTTRNEVRATEDMNPIKGLDEPLVPLNMLILDHLGRPTNLDPAAGNDGRSTVIPPDRLTFKGSINGNSF